MFRTASTLPTLLFLLKSGQGNNPPDVMSTSTDARRTHERRSSPAHLHPYVNGTQRPPGCAADLSEVTGGSVLGLECLPRTSVARVLIIAL